MEISMPSLLQYKSNDCLQDNSGNVWCIYYVKYTTKNGYDEVVQLKVNGKERGHVTWHYDHNGKLLKMNEHGDITIPSGLKPCEDSNRC
jgi:hypothetical protein